MRGMSTSTISKLPPFDPGSDAVNVMVEMPRGCRTKFKYDDKSGLFQFDKMMPTGLTFPFDFGFLPSTRGGEGDPLDVLILAEEPTFPGCLILRRLLGIRDSIAQQAKKGRKNLTAISRIAKPN